MKKGWKTRKIGDVCSLMTGGTPSKAKHEYFGGKIKWLVSGDVHKGQIFDCEGRITEAGMKNSNAKWLPVNSVVIALNGQGKTRGTVALLRTQATCNQSLVSIYPNEPEELLPEFLYINLHSRYQEIRQMTGDSGNDRRGLNMNLIKSIEIPLAPLSEQKRLIGILDEVVEGLATAKVNAEKNLQNARALFKSHLNAVFSQRSEGWQTKTIDDVCEVVNGGTPKTGIADYWDGKHQWITPAEMGKRLTPYIGETARSLTDLGLANSSARLLPPFSVILSSRAPIGHLVINTKPMATNQGCKGLVPSKAIEHKYLYYYLTSIVDLLNDLGTGATFKEISGGKLKEVKVPICPLPEQHLIIKQLDTLSAETQRLESIYQQKLEALGELKKSLLNQAFTGDL